MPYILSIRIWIFFTGTTAQESDMDWFTIAGPDLENWNEDQFRGFVASKLNPFGKEITEKVLELYPFENTRLTLDNMITDVRGACGNNLLAEKASKALKSGVYR